MDSHDLDPVQAALWSQAQCLHVQEEQLSQFQWDLAGMAKRQEGLLATVSDQLSSLSSQLNLNAVAYTVDSTAPATLLISTPISAPTQLAQPEKFSWDSGAFLAQCDSHFELLVHQFPTERARVANVTSSYRQS